MRRGRTPREGVTQGAAPVQYSSNEGINLFRLAAPGRNDTSRVYASTITSRLRPPHRRLPRTYALGMDTIAGAEILQLRFGLAGASQPGQAVLHDERRARFIRIREGGAVTRHCGDGTRVAVPPETLALPPPSGPALGATSQYVGARARVTRSR